MRAPSFRTSWRDAGTRNRTSLSSGHEPDVEPFHPPAALPSRVELEIRASEAQSLIRRQEQWQPWEELNLRNLVS